MAPRSENSLPNSLILLIHLHLLNFPLKSASGYDENLFNPQKYGIGERSKALEDITYFLVSKVEGQKSHAKKLLPTYPCAQPSDTLSYRTALAKYLEALRNDVLRPNISSNSSPDPPNGQGRLRIPWWWRDVIVRKSLLEECAGERFERLLLALSTHTLLKCTPRNRDFLLNVADVTQDTAINTYRIALATFEDARLLWERAASNQNRRRKNLKLLRERISDSVQTKYDHLPSGRLVALSQSAFDDLVKSSWKGEAGRNALGYLLGLAGLNKEVIVGTAPPDGQPADFLSTTGTKRARTGLLRDIPPLPITAAHFPSQLKLLRLTSFNHADANDAESNESCNVDIAPQIVSDALSAETRTQADLQTALANAERVEKDLAFRLQAARSSRTDAGDVHTLSLSSFDHVGDELSIARIDLQKTSKNPQEHEAVIQARVTQIRQSLRPSWPLIPDMTSLEPEPQSVPSRLPQPVAQRTSSDQQRSKEQITFTASTVSGEAVRESKGKRGWVPTASPRKSNALAVGRARRSSAFAPRKILALDQFEIERIVDSFLDESTSDISLSRSHSPTTPYRHNITKGKLVTPRSAVTVPPRPSFDIDRHERAMITELPRKSLGHDSDGGRLKEEDEPSDREGDVYEGNSVTLKEILLQADATQYDLLRQNELLDDNFEW